MKPKSLENWKQSLATFIPAAILALAPLAARAENQAALTNNIGTGYVRNVLVDPKNPSVLYASTGPAPIKKSVNGGASWSDAGAGLNAWTMSIAIDPNNSSILYAGTWGVGVYMSLDAGATWVPANQQMPDTTIYALAIDHGNPATLLAATENGVYRARLNTPQPIWELVLYTAQRMTTLTADPTSSTTFYASSGESGQQGKIYRTLSNGLLWQQVGNAMEGTVWSMAVDPSNPSVLYAGVDDYAFNPAKSGLYKSVDHGDNWAQLAAVPASAGVSEAIAIAPGNPKTIYAGTYYDGVLRSRDGGATWTSVGPHHTEVRALAIDPVTPWVYYTGTNENGLFRNTVKADFDGNNRSDIFWQNTSTGEMDITTMNGTSVVANGQISLGQFVLAGWRIAGTGDFNGDGRADVVLENINSGATRIAFLSTHARLSGPTRFYDATSQVAIASPGNGWRVAAVGDFDGDGHSDILWENGPNHKISWMNGSSIQSTGDVAAIAGCPGCKAIAAGDLNGDGKADILWEYPASGTKAVSFMDGGNITSTVVFAKTALTWQLGGFGDFNNDGKLDILWQDIGSGERKVWFMDGTTKVGEASLGAQPTVWSIQNR